MLSFARRAITFEPEREIFLSIPDNRHPTISRLNFSGDLSIGLRLVLDQYIPHADSSAKHHSAVGIVLQNPANIFKSIAASLSSVTSPSSPIGKESEFGCFLNSCHLCKKRLKSGEDVYMYMGDQGFCSVECRTRQIAMDERKEVEEALDRRLIASASPSYSSDSPKCPNGNQCETYRVLEDLRRWRQSRKSAKR